MSRHMPKISGYELIERLARSNIGEIYKAKQVSLGRVVALKVLDPELAEKELQRFLREAQSSARLKHPNIVALHDVGHCTTSDLHFLALEYIEGPTLKGMLAREKILPEPRVLSICLGVAEALTGAQEQRIVHRDIQPSKILLASGDVPKLAGLGLSKREDGMGKTIAGTRRLGSPFYSAPELLEEGRRKVDGRADLYSLGMMMFRMLTGHLPYADRPVLERGLALREEGVPLASRVNPKVSAQISHLVCQLCAWEPDDRLPDAQALIVALLRLGARHPTPRDPGDGDSSSEEYLFDTKRFSLPITIEITVEKNGQDLFRQVFEHDKVVIGRGLGCDLRIDDPVISRRHAQLKLEGGKLRLSPLSTTNDTSLNGQSVSESTPVDTGGEVLLSHEILLRVDWEYEEEEEQETPTKNWESKPEDEARVEGPTAATACVNVDVSEFQDAAPAIDDLLEPPREVTRVLPPKPGADLKHFDEDEPADDDYEPTRKLKKKAQGEAGEEHRTRRIPPTSENPAGYLFFTHRDDQRGPVAVEQVFQIGSGVSCDLNISHPAPRKVAIVIRCHDELWLLNVAPDPDWLTLNGEPLDDRARLTEGDYFEIGGTEIRYSHKL